MIGLQSFIFSRSLMWNYPRVKQVGKLNCSTK